MEYTTKDILAWVFTHPELKAATENYVYLCNMYLGDYTKNTNSGFINAIDSLWQIVTIGNPQVCAGLFAKTSDQFVNARKTQRNEEMLLSYIGQMFCNHWMGQDYLNIQLQSEIAAKEYKGSFWERHGNKVTGLGSMVLAAASTLAGCPAGAAAGSAARGYRSISESHNEDLEGSIRHFNKLRFAILSLKF